MTTSTCVSVSQWPNSSEYNWISFQFNNRNCWTNFFAALFKDSEETRANLQKFFYCFNLSPVVLSLWKQINYCPNIHHIHQFVIVGSRAGWLSVWMPHCVVSLGWYEKRHAKFAYGWNLCTSDILSLLLSAPGDDCSSPSPHLLLTRDCWVHPRYWLASWQQNYDIIFLETNSETFGKWMKWIRESWERPREEMERTF